MILMTLVDTGGKMMPPSPNMDPSASGTSSPAGTSTAPPSSTSTAPHASDPPPTGTLPIGGYDPPPKDTRQPSAGSDSGCAVGRPSSPLGSIPVAGVVAALAALLKRRPRRR
jgi:hypothetical protein